MLKKEYKKQQIWLFPKILAVINSPFHKHIFYGAHLLQSSVGHQLTQEQARGKGLLIKNPIVPFQSETLSAGELGMEERVKKRPPMRASYVPRSLGSLFFTDFPDIFSPEMKSTRSGTAKQTPQRKHFHARMECCRSPICGKTGNLIVGGKKFKVKYYVESLHNGNLSNTPDFSSPSPAAPDITESSQGKDHNMIYCRLLFLKMEMVILLCLKWWVGLIWMDGKFGRRFFFVFFVFFRWIRDNLVLES